LVGHNKKGCCKGNVAKKPTRGSKFKRPIIVATEGQPTKHSYHTTFAN